ncbi:6-hydroxymethylpterin diphosphokinase MptE-like protein [Aliarcobacter butzleri]|uniref:6-hydroxymethylpterin diphosphokinase MptE-like protein n=1 Tax=Aliarcobacter butzleri TaxID=28197 RepID=UPI003AF70EA1
MIEAQTQLQNALTTTFLANLAFLSEYDNELYHRVDELSRMIESGTYKEKYALEFLMENGEFDIYDIVNDKYLYNKNPKKINNDLIRKIEFDSRYSISNLPLYFLYREQAQINKDNRFNYEERIDLNYLTQNNMWEYANILDDFLTKQKKRIKTIDKFVFLGTLLGRHIPKIAQKVDARIYLVLERNLEIFRLSLFTVDYTILAQKGVVFSIMEDTFSEERSIFNFLNIAIVENYRIKFSTTGININDYIDKLLTTFHNFSPINYDYNRRLYIFINRVTNYINKYNFILFDKIKDFNLLNNIPILYIAAGPSLDENLEWIKQNQNKFFIVTVGAAYKKLLSNDVKINIITTVDEKSELCDIQFDDKSVSKISNKTIILASAITNEKVLKKFNPKNLFIYEIYIPFHKNNVAFDGLSIGELTLDILLKFNSKEIYLIGLDMALNQITGATHAKDSGSGVATIINLENEQNKRELFNEDTIIKVKGNLLDEVSTIPRFYSSKKDLEIKLEKNTNTNIYNLSTHGAYFEGTIPKNINNINIEEFKDIELDNNILNIYLTKNSMNKLKKESKELLKKDILFLEYEIKKLLDEIENTNFTNFEDFKKETLFIAETIFKRKSLSFYQIIFQYLEMLIPYLSYHFNDVRIKDENKKVNKIKEIFVKQITNIINDYTFCIKRVL